MNQMKKQEYMGNKTMTQYKFDPMTGKPIVSTRGKDIELRGLNINSRISAISAAHVYRYLTSKGLEIYNGSQLVHECFIAMSNSLTKAGIEKPESTGQAIVLLDRVITPKMKTIQLRNQIAQENETLALGEMTADYQEKDDLNKLDNVIRDETFNFTTPEMMQLVEENLRKLRENEINPIAGIKPGQVVDIIEDDEIGADCEDDINAMAGIFSNLNQTEDERNGDKE